MNTKISAELKPQFNHEEVYELYRHGLSIPHDLLKNIIELPHATLIQDLETILDDAVKRYPYFKQIEFSENTHTAPLHSLFILMEIGAAESLNAVLLFLKGDEDFLEIWMGDHLTETLWLVLYALGLNHTKKLEEFLLTPGIYTHVKTSVSKTLAQIFLHDTSRKEEITSIYSNLLNVFNRLDEKDELLDTELVGFFVGDIIDCDLKELIPLIKESYDTGTAWPGINGTYEEVLKYFSQKNKKDERLDIDNLFTLYKNVVKYWAGYQKEKIALTPFLKSEHLSHPTPVSSNKTGRNEPCPCGSGKKYKKCHGGVHETLKL